MKTIATDKQSVIVGLGKTGLSCVRYLSRKGQRVIVMDSRDNPPGLDDLKAEFPNVQIRLGEFDVETLSNANEIILSPGVALSTPAIQKAANNGVVVRGDIDLFASEAKAPIIAITGSNGKTTVTTLVGEMAKASGIDVGVGGNIGTPALDLLEHQHDLYVLELSSFQLETTHSLNAACAVLLNISEDHMDRYASRMEYLQAKQRIFRGAKFVVVNDDEALSQPLMAEKMVAVHYGLSGQDLKKFALSDNDELVRGFDALMPVSEMALKGRHNVSNALAALAIGSTARFNMDAMLGVLKTFKGLDHRCQWVCELGGVDYINDSKGTNAGATAAAIQGFASAGKRNIVLLAGGDSKEADMGPVADAMKVAGKAAILFGQDANKLEAALTPVVPTFIASDFREAVSKANSEAVEGDVVLLSPACASFDMFKNYEERGHIFVQEVQNLAGGAEL